VVVVGGGASGTQHLMEIAEVAADTFWVTRRPPVFREGPFGEDQGRAAVAMVEERVRRGCRRRAW
jgi:cation diffusion facilitator CzcD-associated flavoprotein CzcO